MDAVSAHIFHANAVKIRGFEVLWWGRGGTWVWGLTGNGALELGLKGWGALKDGEEQKLEELNEQKHGGGQGEQSRIS